MVSLYHEFVNNQTFYPYMHGQQNFCFVYGLNGFTPQPTAMVMSRLTTLFPGQA